MAMTCRQLWRQVSEYLDGTVAPELKQEIERHLAHCRHCCAIVDGVRNVVILVADGRVFALPMGFEHRLRQRLKSGD